jgi:hypothetical protein
VCEKIAGLKYLVGIALGLANVGRVIAPSLSGIDAEKAGRNPGWSSIWR